MVSIFAVLFNLGGELITTMVITRYLIILIVPMFIIYGRWDKIRARKHLEVMLSCFVNATIGSNKMHVSFWLFGSISESLSCLFSVVWLKNHDVVFQRFSRGPETAIRYKGMMNKIYNSTYQPYANHECLFRILISNQWSSCVCLPLYGLLSRPFSTSFRRA